MLFFDAGAYKLVATEMIPPSQALHLRIGADADHESAWLEIKNRGYKSNNRRHTEACLSPAAGAAPGAQRLQWYAFWDIALNINQIRPWEHGMRWPRTESTPAFSVCERSVFLTT